jgi:bifunctional non-homologous end joining protein LigD
VTVLELDGRRVELTTPGRILWPQAGFTKRDLVDYYVAIAAVLVPHIAGRPLTLGRFPEGVDGRGFAQTECRGAPEWLRTAPIRLRGGEVRNYCVVDDAAGLAWLGNRSAIELHVFPSRDTRLDQPGYTVFDLDPGPGADVFDCCDVGLAIRDELERHGVPTFAKTSGSVGLHVLAPPLGDFDRTRAVARAVADDLTAAQPARVVADVNAPREGKVLVDWLQNAPMRSLVAPYSPRAAPFPAVSTPVTWEEVERAAADRRPELLTFTVRDVVRRVEAVGDLYAPLLT